MIAWPLDGKQYTAEPIGAYNGTRTRGVFSDENCFKVTPAGGLKVTLSKGFAWLKPEEFWGLAVYQKESQQFTIPAGTGAQPRYLGIAIQFNKTTNEVGAVLKTGEYAADPQKPTPAQNAYYDEIIPATIIQRPGAVEITAADIIDERHNEAMCGLMRDGVTRIPTAMLTAQVEALIDQLVAAVEQAAGGQTIDGSITPEKLADSTKELFAPAYSYGTADKTPGSHSDLPDGSVYWKVAQT